MTKWKQNGNYSGLAKEGQVVLMPLRVLPSENRGSDILLNSGGCNITLELLQ